MASWTGPLERVDRWRWDIPVSYKQEMRVPGRIYADGRLMEQMREEQALDQVANVACLPGIVGHSLAMPDMHQGYGFPVGGVAAMRVSDGVVSPGGVGVDINCGVRLLRTALTEKDVRPKLSKLADALYKLVPAGTGVGSGAAMSEKDFEQVLVQGAAWPVSQGMGHPLDLEVTEERGRLRGADPAQVSARARGRGRQQLGTLGSGNHFLEIQIVADILLPDVATAFGLTEPGQVVVMIHTGSRGLGYQVCDDHVRIAEAAAKRYGIDIPDRQLACTPIQSPEGQNYLAAMAAAANFAFANRQVIAANARLAFGDVLGRSSVREMRQVYDVCHNIAKLETYDIDGVTVELCVHRKGATRAFPAHHPGIPEKYREVGQPVIIPGDMGRESYVAVGTEAALTETFGSSCHGAGRLMSRGAARRSLEGVDMVKRMAKDGVIVRAQSKQTLAEEAPSAYKNVSEVVSIVEGAGIARAVARLRPICVIKG